MTKLHSNIGASSAERWMNCPGSVKLSEGVEKKTSIYAVEGTVAHWLSETCLLSAIDPHDWVGEVREGVTITEEMADAVAFYVSYIKGKAGGNQILVEETFRLDWIDEDLFGTNDCAIIEPFKKATIVDFKYGKGVRVKSEENKQLMYYALGATKGMDVDEVEMVIVQPRVGDTFEDKVSSWTVPVSRLGEFEVELKESVAATRAKNPVLNAGDHCKFCPAAPTCPKLRDEAYAVAKTVFQPITKVDLPTPTSLTPDEVKVVLDGASLLSTWVNEVEEYAHSMAERGISVPGYKLVAKRANRKWVDEKRVIAEFVSVFGDSIYEPKSLLSPAKLEKMIGKETVEKFTTKESTGTTLVPMGDKRSEVKPATLVAFTATGGNNE